MGLLTLAALVLRACDEKRLDLLSVKTISHHCNIFEQNIPKKTKEEAAHKAEKMTRGMQSSLWLWVPCACERSIRRRNPWTRSLASPPVARVRRVC